MTTSSNNPPPRVVAARSELQQCLDGLRACQAILDGILKRPDPQPVERDQKGWPLLGGDVHDPRD